MGWICDLSLLLMLLGLVTCKIEDAEPVATSQGIYVNEVYAAGDDRIEIYNKSATAVNLAGMYLSDDKNNPFKHKIPSNNATLTTIPAGGYLVIWADNTQGQGPLHIEFALAKAGEDVALFYLDGRTFESYNFGAQSENISSCKTIDSATTWKIFTTPTQGNNNQ